jgi:hypothetical protein
MHGMLEMTFEKVLGTDDALIACAWQTSPDFNASPLQNFEFHYPMTVLL